MTRRKLTTLSLPIALLMAGGSVQAAGWTAGDWELSLGGNINTFFMSTSCSAGDLNGGGTMAGFACLGSSDENGAPTDAQSVQNGLLPASLNFNAKTVQDGWNLGANINVYYGITSNNTDGSANLSSSDALKFSTVDARQVFMTFGKEGGGEFKFGRDFGLFGFDPIIADMSLIGSGPNFVAADPNHTTLGGLGYGYVYVDRLAQMNYTTADMSGFKGTIGIFQPFDGNGAVSSGDIGIHAKGSYSRNNYTISATFLTQSVVAGTFPVAASTSNTTPAITTPAVAANLSSQDITGFDVFFKIDIGNLSLAAYLYEAEGMTSLAIGGLLLPGFGASGTPEETSGNMLQATYKATPKLKLGINLGHSEQDVVTKVENDRLTLGAYYNLTKSLILMAELSQNESDLIGVGKDESSNINFGAFLGF